VELREFSKTLKQRPVLSQSELVKLAKLARDGDADARKTLIESNMRLVIKVAGRNFHKARHLGPDDIIQQGFIGLIQAVDRYNPYKLNPKNKKPYKFSTYAVWWIEHHIQQALQFQEDEIHVPFERLKESGFDNPISHSLDNSQIDERTLTHLLESPEYVIDDITADEYEYARKLLESRDFTGLEREIIKLAGGLVDGIMRSDKEIATLLNCEIAEIKKIKKQARGKLSKQE